MRLSRLREPFDHPDWLFEIKHDGFRALAYIEGGRVRLVSRNGNSFKSFAGLTAWLSEHVRVRDGILDGEIVCFGPDGRSMFNTLLYRGAEPYFFAFDCLWLNGSDLRGHPLTERKHILRGIVPPQPARLVYVEHVEERGCDLYRAACELDLEGIVAKLADAPYEAEPQSWIKVKNSGYTQAIGRRERFDRMRAKSASATTRTRA